MAKEAEVKTEVKAEETAVKKEKKEKKKALNPQFDKPSTKTDITKNFMLGYIKAVAPQDAKWFKQLCKEHIVKRDNHLTKKQYEDIDVKFVRNAFVEKYFPALNIKKDYNENKKSFLDLIDEL